MNQKKFIISEIIENCEEENKNKLERKVLLLENLFNSFSRKKYEIKIKIHNK